MGKGKLFFSEGEEKDQRSGKSKWYEHVDMLTHLDAQLADFAKRR